jgi:hypothetical protein
MRLLNAKTKKLEEFFDKSIPKYAILSHTWGENEVTFRDFGGFLGRRKPIKIEGCCAQALKDRLDYLWIDTCCIDKSSSAELSEAINSMFAWYERAEVCYVYLADVRSNGVDPEDEDEDFRNSRWFTRGWTLQELLAPKMLMFYNTSWKLLGHLTRGRGSTRGSTMGLYLSDITGIPEAYVSGSIELDKATIAMKMSWASTRQTTRIEDLAYCLLGAFDVAMPMLYGEGAKAFVRLQEEIMKKDDDHTIFAWGYGSTSGVPQGLAAYFARSPAAFSGCSEVRRYRRHGINSSHHVITNQGLLIEMCVLQLVTGEYIGELNCTHRVGHVIAIPLVKAYADDNIFYRPVAIRPAPVWSDMFHAIDKKSIYISSSMPRLVRWRAGIKFSRGFLNELKVVETHPPNWDLSQGLFWEEEVWKLIHQQQLLFLNCFNTKGVNFIVRIDYTFMDTFDGSWAMPQTAKILAGQMPSMPAKILSLFEVLAPGVELDKFLALQQVFIFERIEVSSDERQICDSYPRRLRLQLNRSDRHEWEIDLVDVNDPHRPVTRVSKYSPEW